MDGINPPADAEIPGGARGRFDELPQLNRGFLDANTTLVTLSIGGNDLGFSPILEHCVKQALSNTICRDSASVPSLPGDTLGNGVTARLGTLAADVGETLAAIRNRAPYAKILMLGYPMLFKTGGNCAGILDRDRPWLNEVATNLNAELTKAAANAGSHVTYADPQYEFEGNTLCSDTPGITPLTLNLTPGDRPMVYIPLPGEDKPVGISAQSVHPNAYGTTLYSRVANAALRSERVPLSASITGGAATTYYASFRWHDGGPALMNMTAFSGCGKEIRLGLRKSPDGQQQNIGAQDTQTLSWTKPHAMQTFLGSSSASPNLAAGFYAVNARMTTACAGGTSQSWSGALYW